jgi:hypothetical protein
MQDSTTKHNSCSEKVALIRLIIPMERYSVKLSSADSRINEKKQLDGVPELLPTKKETLADCLSVGPSLTRLSLLYSLEGTGMPSILGL